MRCSSTQHHSLSKLFTGSFLAEIQGQTQKIQKGVAGTLTRLSSVGIIFIFLTIL